MKKRWITALIILALLISCFGTVSFADTTYRQEDVEREIQELMAKYCGTYWRGNYLGAIQCKGFADMVFIPGKNTSSPALIVELKYNKDADAAIDQIKRKNYPAKLADYAGNLLLVGINYDKKTKTHTCHIEKA